MKTTTSVACCNNCKFFSTENGFNECNYNSKITNSFFAFIIIPDKYVCVCKRFEEKDNDSH